MKGPENSGAAVRAQDGHDNERHAAMAAKSVRGIGVSFYSTITVRTSDILQVPIKKLTISLFSPQVRASQSLRWCSAKQSLTNLHLPQTCPRTAGRATLHARCCSPSRSQTLRSRSGPPWRRAMCSLGTRRRSQLNCTSHVRSSC